MLIGLWVRDDAAQAVANLITSYKDIANDIFYIIYIKYLTKQALRSILSVLNQ